MKDRYIPALIMLCAGAVTCILDIYNKVELITSLKRLLLVLIIFYIIGLITKAIILRVTQIKPKMEEKQIENKEEDSKENNKENNENTVSTADKTGFSGNKR